MNKISKTKVIFIFVFSVFLIYNNPVISSDLQDKSIIKVKGKGLYPENSSNSQAKVLCKRAAMVDAYRNMAKELYGSKTSTKGNITTKSVQGMVNGAIVTKENYGKNDCEVELTLTYKGFFNRFGKIYKENKSLQNELKNLKKESISLKEKIIKLEKQIKDFNIKLQNLNKNK